MPSCGVPPLSLTWHISSIRVVSTEFLRICGLLHVAGRLSALEISASVAFSASLTCTPPMPRKPPSLAASATCWLICRSQPLKAAASPGALVSTNAPACRSVSTHLSLISAGFQSVVTDAQPVVRQGAGNPRCRRGVEADDRYPESEARCFDCLSALPVSSAPVEDVGYQDR